MKHAKTHGFPCWLPLCLVPLACSSDSGSAADAGRRGQVGDGSTRTDAGVSVTIEGGGATGHARDAVAPFEASGTTDGSMSSVGVDASGNDVHWSCLSDYSSPPNRDAATWPFAVDSIWNTSVGSDAQYGQASDPATGDLTTDGGTINCGQWSVPVYVATSDDPVCKVYHGSTLLGSPNCPTNAQEDPSSDATLILVDASHRTSYEMCCSTSKVSDGWKGGNAGTYDLTGSGIGTWEVRAYGGSAMGGLIRADELKTEIRHPLAFAIDSSRQTQTWIWPAITNDYRSDYAGHLPMGTLVAIPSNVDLCNLGLSAPGLALARALQDYGAYLVDSSTGLVFYAEDQLAEDNTQSSAVSAASGDLGKIVPQMRVVTNSTQSSVGGGGTARAPLAPPIR